MRKTWMISACCLLAVALSAPMSAARSESSEEAQLRILLQFLNAHEFKVSRKGFDRIGTDVNRLLVSISGDPRQRPTIRVRATSSLAVFPSERSQRYLNGVLYDPELKKNKFGLLQRREAMMSLGAAFKGDAVQTLAGFYDHEDPQIREGCAHALGITGSDRALPPLKAWLPNEPEIFVREAIERAIERLGQDKRR